MGSLQEGDKQEKHFIFSSRRRHTRCSRDWSSDVCSSDLIRRQRLEGGGKGRTTRGTIRDARHGQTRQLPGPQPSAAADERRCERRFVRAKGKSSRDRKSVV